MQWQSARAAYRQTMRVQSGIIGAIQADAPLLADLVGRSQDAAGSLQAQQAGNQLLALSIKQQMQLQNLMAAQYRADAETQAATAEANAMARERTRRFLGDGHAYSR
jgi:P-type conjugative transfer protein TrbJ